MWGRQARPPKARGFLMDLMLALMLDLALGLTIEPLRPCRLMGLLPGLFQGLFGLGSGEGFLPRGRPSAGGETPLPMGPRRALMPPLRLLAPYLPDSAQGSASLRGQGLSAGQERASQS